jgi:putative solute:sodium symporter small subunit
MNRGDMVRKIDKSKADAYFREKTTYMIIYFIIWAIVSYGVVLIAEPLSDVYFNGFPFHYFMGAQGALAVFIILLFINAIVGDKIDKKYGIDDKKNEEIGKSSTVDH